MNRNELIEIITSRNPAVDLEIVNKAIDFAIKYHAHQKRASGEPYYYHVLEVAKIMAEMNLDTTSILTAILHDTIEDTELTYEDIEEHFGKDVAQLVDGVTKLTRLDFQEDEVIQAENFRKLLLAMSEDIRVLLVKLADRLHNMRTIDYFQSNTKRQKIALETMEIYGPLAERIGMHQIKTELQDISFRVLYPQVRESILSLLNNIASDRHDLIDKIIIDIQKKLDEAGVKSEVHGRQKTPYSIWMKMNQKNVSFDQLSDIIAFRIVVDKVESCYAALGVVHCNYKMVPDSFQDFISIPKNNGYQSIHTLVIGPMRQRIEVQIRTEAMHQIAEIGVAAHWMYKQKYNATDGKQFRWLKELLQILNQAHNSEEFLQNTKLEMYYNQVFCFTPKGKLIPLPSGATVIDFAYAVHSDVGNHCAGAKINGQIGSLRTQLKNGDQVEIITNKAQTPVSSWEEFVVTGKARSEIRKYVRQQKSEQYVTLGKSILENYSKEVGVVLNEGQLENAAQHFKEDSVDNLYFALGEGRILRDDVIGLYKQKKSKINALFDFIKSKSFVGDNKNHKGVSVNGLIPGMAIHYAGCCYPIPGDPIVGVLHNGKGVTIHTSDCDNLKYLKYRNEEPIGLSWSEDNSEYPFVVRLVAFLVDKPGSLATMSSEIAKEKANITNFKLVNKSEELFEVLVDIEVNNTDHLNRVITALRQKPEIHSVNRFKH